MLFLLLRTKDVAFCQQDEFQLRIGEAAVQMTECDKHGPGFHFPFRILIKIGFDSVLPELFGHPGGSGS